MSLYLRIALIVISVATMFFVLRKIRKSQMRIDDAVSWILISLVLVVLSVFPYIAIKASELLGVISASNFVFLCIIFILLVKIFLLSLKLSQLDSKLQTLIQTYAIAHKGQKENNALDKAVSDLTIKVSKLEQEYTKHER